MMRRYAFKTLVLNTDMSPIGKCTIARGWSLCHQNKAYELESSGVEYRSEFLSLFAPKVIVLYEYKKIDFCKRTPLVSKGKVLLRDNYRCQYCGAAAATVDHVVPRSKGGEKSWLNLVACCASCNMRKGSKSLSQMGMKLLSKPRIPQFGELMHSDG
uniref:HNH nuclease domain-containing protein n=1 Tax=Chrysotila carterae TaxID=13221 RepID=A0A6S9XGW0_CHRCT|mmetsp:Transcript_59112/g.128321  ORF Transcript_59112/g.128321 Transcript_59112/m.128321 type:complete len:157 (-) Transcript_59112:494-964(-)